MTHCPRCGKKNVDPIFPHTCTPPLALQLATTPEAVIPIDIETTAMLAAELRRLHAENVELKAKADVAEAGYRAAVSKACWQESTNRELNNHIEQKVQLRMENEALRKLASDAAELSGKCTQQLTQDEALLRQALEALESCDAEHPSDGYRQWYDSKAVDAAIAAINERLK